ncbi:MAG: HD domain-containing protein [Thermacetogeniaceae bacterium]|jgi:putative nucleotidyltransferase with HDIG domain|nr:HD domain-containing protein [Syntrophomonadaceae bacterium]
MERIDAIVRDHLFRECLDKNRATEENREFCKHDMQHFVDVARITYILLLESDALVSFCQDNNLDLQAAKEVVYAAGILHDIGRWHQYETGEDHSIIGAELAGEILERAGFSPQEIRIITRAIREHREQRLGMSLLGELLYRADNLSRACHQCSAKDKCYKFPTMETGNLVMIY